MAPIILFKCRSCNAEIALGTEPVERVSCTRCGSEQEVRISPSLGHWRKVMHCIACGHDDLYVQKDFNRQVGVAIVVVGILASTYFFHYRQPFLAMASLVVTALIDLTIYSLVG